MTAVTDADVLEITATRSVSSCWQPAAGTDRFRRGGPRRRARGTSRAGRPSPPAKRSPSSGTRSTVLVWRQSRGSKVLYGFCVRGEPLESPRTSRTFLEASRFVTLVVNGLFTRAIIVAVALAMVRSAHPLGFAPWQPPAGANLPVYRYAVVRTFPHDRDAFTQGLQFLDGFLYEGTGLNGRSSIRKVKLETGEVVQRRDVPAQYFGEGIVVWQSELFELTWQSGVAFIYDRATFAPRRSVKYQGEGWGLTHDGASLIMSDGSDSLRFLDPATFDERRRLKVTAAGVPLRALNELEYVKGEIFANVWQTDYIARIDPKTGRVTGWVDLQGLLPARDRASTDVLNGIAYDAAGDRLFITGKLWPRLFEITLTAPVK